MDSFGEWGKTNLNQLGKETALAGSRKKSKKLYEAVSCYRMTCF